MDHCVTSEITCRINIPYQLLQYLLFNIPPAVWLCLFKPQNLEITQTSFVFQKICAETQTFVQFFWEKQRQMDWSPLKRTTFPNNKCHYFQVFIPEIIPWLLYLPFPGAVKIKKIRPLESAACLKLQTNLDKYWVSTEIGFCLEFSFREPWFVSCNKNSCGSRCALLVWSAPNKSFLVNTWTWFLHVIWKWPLKLQSNILRSAFSGGHFTQQVSGQWTV